MASETSLNFPNPVSVGSGSMTMAMQQQTVAAPVECIGVGLHSGQQTQVRILPAAVNHGRVFVRVDLPGQPQVPAHLAHVHQTILSTELRQGEATVRTVEHLLASLWGLGIDNARIEVDGSELPLLDGSALDWVNAIAAVGTASQTGTRQTSQLSDLITVQQGDAFVSALPAPQLRLTYGIDFDLSAIGNQWHSWSPVDDSDFATAIAPARTFGLAHQIEALRQQGLIKGGSLDNALVCGETGWLNPPLRFENEPARHKLLDLVGDLSLLGTLPPMHVVAYKASHKLHAQFAQQLSAILGMTS